MIESFTVDGILHERPKSQARTRRRSEFDFQLLSKMDSNQVEYFAEDYLDMINPDDCECDDCSELIGVDDDDLIDELETRGFIIWKTSSLINAIEINELKQKLGL